MRHEEAFKATLPRNADVVLTKRVSGINLNGGRKLDLAVYVRKAAGS